jgi:hypothetical protein
MASELNRLSEAILIENTARNRTVCWMWDTILIGLSEFQDLYTITSTQPQSIQQTIAKMPSWHMNFT